MSNGDIAIDKKIEGDEGEILLDILMESLGEESFFTL